MYGQDISERQELKQILTDKGIDESELEDLSVEGLKEMRDSYNDCRAKYCSNNREMGNRSDRPYCLTCDVWAESELLSLQRRAEEGDLDADTIDQEVSKILNHRGLDRSRLTEESHEHLRNAVEEVR